MADSLLTALGIYAVLLVVGGGAAWALCRQAARLDAQADKERRP